MTTNEKARDEAFRRYAGDSIIDENTGEMVSHDDYGYSETARQAFVSGAMWAAPDHQAEAPSASSVLALIDTWLNGSAIREPWLPSEVETLLSDVREMVVRDLAAHPVVDDAGPEGEA